MTSTDLDISPSTLNQTGKTPKPSHNSNSSTPVYLKTSAIGYMALLMSMLENADSVQTLESQGLMTLTEDANNMTEQYSAAWMAIMNNPNDAALLKDMAANPGNVTADYAKLSDLGKLTWDSGSSTGLNSSQQQFQVNEDMTKFNADNTSYNQANSFWGGITSGLNSTVSNITNQVSLDYQQIQSSPLAIQATILSVV
jgi:hypothetical protein